MNAPVSEPPADKPLSPQLFQVPAPGDIAPPADLPKPGAQHVAIIMDGNGRWANAQGLPRTAGHQAGEIALLDTVAGAIAAGVTHLSVYAFSTENWKRSPAEVRFLMGYSRQVLRARRDQLAAWGVRIRWSGREKRLWPSVLKELRTAEAQTKHNTGLQLIMCLNYGGQAELADAAAAIGRQIAAGKLKPGSVNEKTLARHLYLPDVPPVDLLIRTSGEQRLSNFLLFQAAYAELCFTPEPWPQYNRHLLWRDLAAFGQRERRLGGAVDAVRQQ